MATSNPNTPEVLVSFSRLHILTILTNRFGMAPHSHTVLNYDENTIERLTLDVLARYCVSDLEENKIKSLSWSQRDNWISVVGENNLLKVIQIGTEPTLASTYLYSNQNLVGSKETVLNATWNENHKSLTAWYTSGSIIVWKKNDEWMIFSKKRLKMPIVDVSWNAFGLEFAVVFENGTISVFDLKGNELWERQTRVSFTCCEWAFEPEKLAFGSADGSVSIYDTSGTYYRHLHMTCLENTECESSSHRNSKIASMKYWRDVALNRTCHEPVQPIPPNRPRFLVAYVCGSVQLFRSLNDQSPVVIRIPEFATTGATWSPNGSFFAVCGQVLKQNQKQSTIYFYTSYGKAIGSYKGTSDETFSGISWNGCGRRMAISFDDKFIVGTFRHQFKWGAMTDTIVYVHLKEELYQYHVTFYNYETNEKISKTSENFLQIACKEKSCILVSRPANISDDTYLCEHCDMIGTILEQKTTTVYPKFAGINGMSTVITSDDKFFVWHFLSPSRYYEQKTFYMPGNSDEFVWADQINEFESRSSNLEVKEKICALAVGDTFFLVAVESGKIYRVGLTDGKITHRYHCALGIESMKLNCTSTSVAIFTPNRRNDVPELQVYNIEEPEPSSYVVQKSGLRGYEWHSIRENSLAFQTIERREKKKIFVLNKKHVVELTNNVHGMIFQFQDETISSVDLESILMNPHNPPRNALQKTCTIPKLGGSYI